MNPRLTVVVVVLALAIGAPAPMLAQAVYGSVFGTTMDTSGAVIVGARVTVISVQKGTRVETTTNQSGNYSVTHLIPDNYTVRVEAPRFSSFEVSAILVHADEALHVDAQLQVGG